MNIYPPPPLSSFLRVHRIKLTAIHSNLSLKLYGFAWTLFGDFIPRYLIKMIHLDPKKPENHNVYISNLKNGYIMVYDGDKWDTLNREEIIENMINDRECLIQDRVEDWLENGKNYPIIMRKFERYLEKKEKDVVLNKIKEEIRLMLFNSRNMINKNMINKNPPKLLLDTEEQTKV